MSPSSHNRREAKRSSGFTVVELVVVIVLVGILAAVGISRFIRVDDEAHTARMEGLAGALQTAAASFHANWRVRGGGGVDMPGWGDESLDANSFGFPAGGRGDVSVVGRDRDCEDIWRGLLQNGPEVIEADPNKEIGTSINHIEPKLGTDVAVVAGQDASIPDATVPLPATPNAEICQFISLHYQSVQPGTPKPTIFYDSRTGEVFTDLDRVF
jgi:prepilin-type N-terminal cleavage/methylation domain-containing protein